MKSKVDDGFTFDMKDVKRFADLVKSYAFYNGLEINDRTILAVMNDPAHKPDMLAVAGTGMGILAFGRAIRAELDN